MYSNMDGGIGGRSNWEVLASAHFQFGKSHSYSVTVKSWVQPQLPIL